MSERLELLRPILSQYRRRFTVLDLGSGIEPNQNVGQEIAREYDAVVVAVEKDWQREKFLESKHTIVLKREMNWEDLSGLSMCEHFDIVLAFNILHWAPADEWFDFYTNAVDMAERAFIQIPATVSSELPGREFLPDLVQVIKNEHGSRYLGSTTQFPGHEPRPLWHIAHGPLYRQLSRTHLGAPPMSSDAHIRADFIRIIVHHKNNWRAWVPGFNLANLMKLGMVWPPREKMVELLREYKLPPTNHGDVVLHNFVFDGEQLYLVDGFEGWEFDDREGLDKVISEVQEW